MHNTATLKINMLAEKDFDGEVLKEFVANKLRSELESVQETLMKNGIYYFPTESFSKPMGPQPVIEVPSEILKEWQRGIRGEIIFFISKSDSDHAFGSCKKLHLTGEKIPLEHALEIIRLFEQERRYQDAIDVLEFCLKLYPDKRPIWNLMGFIKSEYLFDWEGGYECFKKGAEIDLKSIVT